MLNYLKVLITLSFLSPFLAAAHSGGLDTYGGHTDRKTGEYHCHQEPCFTIQYERINKSAAQNFTRTKAYSLDNDETLPEYNRDDWNHWIDSDKDCHDTRAELLMEQSRNEVVFSETNKCVVASGEWLDPYTNTLFTLAPDVDIDHIVPLEWAHEHGGAEWSKDKKEIFANDAENLLIVDKIKNREKGSKGLNEWLPPNQNYQCTYAKKWLNVTEKYNLLYRTEEVIDLSEIIDTCNLQ